jgi:hypothetical protein
MKALVNVHANLRNGPPQHTDVGALAQLTERGLTSLYNTMSMRWHMVHAHYIHAGRPARWQSAWPGLAAGTDASQPVKNRLPTRSEKQSINVQR